MATTFDSLMEPSPPSAARVNVRSPLLSSTPVIFSSSRSSLLSPPRGTT